VASPSLPRAARKQTAHNLIRWQRRSLAGRDRDQLVDPPADRACVAMKSRNVLCRSRSFEWVGSSHCHKCTSATRVWVHLDKRSTPELVGQKREGLVRLENWHLDGQVGLLLREPFVALDHWGKIVGIVVEARKE